MFSWKDWCRMVPTTHTTRTGIGPFRLRPSLQFIFLLITADETVPALLHQLVFSMIYCMNVLYSKCDLSLLIFFIAQIKEKNSTTTQIWTSWSLFLDSTLIRETQWYLSLSQVSTSIPIPTFKKPCHQRSSQPVANCNEMVANCNECLLTARGGC